MSSYNPVEHKALPYDKYTGTEDEPDSLVDFSSSTTTSSSLPYFIIPRRRVAPVTTEEAEAETAAEQQKIQAAIQAMMHDGERFRQPTSLLSHTDINHILVPAFYFILGAFLGTPAVALKFFAINQLHVKPSEFGMLYGFAASPWFLKFLPGSWSDIKPIFGRHRVPYVCASSLLCVFAWIALAIPGPLSRTLLGFGCLVILTNVFTCFADVMMDCLVAKAARDEMGTDAKGNTQSLTLTCRTAGTFVGVVLGKYLVSTVSDLHYVFGVTALYPAIMFVGSLFLVEKRKTPKECETTRTVMDSIKETFNEVRQGRMVIDLAKFILLVNATPSSALTFSYFLIQKLKFTESFMGTLSIIEVLAALAGLATYTRFMRYMALRRVMRISVYAGTALSVLPLILVTRWNHRLGIDDHFFSIGDDIAEAYASQIAQMPLLVAMASVCPEGKEGQVYSGLISLSNFGGVLSMWFGAFLTHIFDIHENNYDNMTLLVFVCMLLNALPLCFIDWLPTNADKHEIIDVAQLAATEEKKPRPSFVT